MSAIGACITAALLDMSMQEYKHTYMYMSRITLLYDLYLMSTALWSCRKLQRVVTTFVAPLIHFMCNCVVYESVKTSQPTGSSPTRL